MGQVVAERMGPYLDGTKEPKIDAYFFVAFSRGVFMGARTEDESRTDELIPIVNRTIRGFPDSIAFARRASLFGGFGSGNTIDVDVQSRNIEALMEAALGGFIGISQALPGARVRPFPGLELAEPADVVVGMYLLGYARNAEQLRGFCKAGHDALRPGGRFVGVNDDVRNPGSGDWKQYGLERTGPTSPAEGDGVRYRITNSDGGRFDLQNFYLSPQTYQAAFREAGFSDFSWVDVSLQPSERGNPFWDEFMRRSPIVGFVATR